MKHSIKSALLSALVFPGLGHIVIKKYIVGAILSVISLGAISFIVSKIMAIATRIVDGIHIGQGPVDVVALADLVTREMQSPDLGSIHTASTVLLIVWVIGLFDSYRQGAILDKAEALVKEKEQIKKELFEKIREKT